MDTILDLSEIPETMYGNRHRASFVMGEIARHQALLGRPANVLDVGCGTGDLLTVWAARLGARVLGIDNHAPSIQMARSRYTLPNLRFEVDDADELLLRDERYDVIICSEVLEHLHEPRELLTTLRKLITPDGICIVTVPNGWGPKENEERVIGVYVKMKRLLRKHSSVVGLSTNPVLLNAGEGRLVDSLNVECGHVQFFTLNAMKRLAQLSGFTIAKRENRRFLSGPISDMLFSKSQRFIEWNVHVARVLPHWLASSWMFVFLPAAGWAD
jgi:2-polyprenyl-3-methyl-5-hydroxy-6-metoxy-1,4-benzoquinol methylase